MKPGADCDRDAMQTRIVAAKNQQLAREAELAAKAYVAREDLEKQIAREAMNNPAVAAGELYTPLPCLG